MNPILFLKKAVRRSCALCRRCFRKLKALIHRLHYAPDYLVLVNRAHPIRPFFSRTIDLCPVKSIPGKAYLAEKQTGASFSLLCAALNDVGIEIAAAAAYRSLRDQNRLMRSYHARYGTAYAEATVAQPGTSEHHTGFAIDIVPKVRGVYLTENKDMLNEQDVFSSIHALLPEYGFILRYPKDGERITGYAYEPWHIRYVGKAAAREIHDRQLTLEEYLNEKTEA